MSGFTTHSAETIAFLYARGVILIGTDAPSIDPETARTMDAHRAVALAGMPILEGLVLEVPAGGYELIALPLKLAGVGAAPVRGILRSYA